MKHLYSKFVTSLVFTLLFNIVYAQCDIYESYLVLDINGNGNEYYDLFATTANTDFDGAILGTFTPSDSFILNGAENKTYKCGLYNIFNGWLNYRVYLATDAPPAFTSTSTLFGFNDGTSNYCGFTSTDQTWTSTGANIDIISGLPSGDYILEVYTHADFDSDITAGTNSDLDGTHYANNDPDGGGPIPPNNYQATFRMDNPPVANCQNITIQLDGSGNASITGNDIDNASTDDFGIASLVASQTSFTCADLGTNNITLTVTDSIGQTDTCVAVVTVEDSVQNATASISSVSATLICQGQSVTMVATGTNLGSNPQYEWFVNGVSVGNNSDTFSSTTINDGDQINVEITSGSCTTNVTAISPSVTISVDQPATADAGMDATMCRFDQLPLFGVFGGSATSGSWSSASGGFTTGDTYFPSISNGTVTLVYTTNNPPGPCGPAVDTMEVTVFFPYFATATNLTTINDCNDTTIQLAGTSSGNLGGQWSAVSVPAGSSFSFSNPTDPNGFFTGESGASYEITWTANQQNAVCMEEDTFSVSFPACADFIDFDGTNDYVNFEDNYNLSGSFSVEAWVKPNQFNAAIQTILSKRDALDNSTGYDLRLVNNTISFNSNAFSISTNGINVSRWYHIAVTYDGTNYNLYVDGVLATTSLGPAPVANTNDMILGAMSRTNEVPIRYFDGWMDEVRIWNTTLNVDQIREMMNQEIEDNTAVRGSVLGLDVAGLNWSNLDAYYQMNQGTGNLAGGFLVGNAGVSGRLSNITTFQDETAPLPYLSANDGNWNNANTWLNSNVQTIPNTNSVDWNIVRTSHNINSGNRATTLLGLLVDANNYNITNNQVLQVTKYLKIDGTIDLTGEAQLLQDTGSIVDYTGTGRLLRDQQGTTNLYGYNYWGSPVGNNGSSYVLSNTLHDPATGVNPAALQWTTNNDANSGTSPITLSSRWLYLYENYLENSYASWNSIDENSSIAVGLGYTMKGSGNAGASQNYTFIGQPNNGTITSPITGGNQALLGNPYPSAIDGHAFINDNNAVLLDGALYFWEHSPTNATHVLSEYEGGYAYLNLTSGVPAVSPPEINGIGTAGKIPERYVPVAQGFFVTGNAAGGSINFNNDQRAFVRESSGNSIFMRTNDGNEQNIVADANGVDDKFLRLDFKSPDSATRHLVLGFMAGDVATDGADYGYDALNNDVFPNDMSFNIEEKDYVIQGVGSFDDQKSYPLNINLTEGGTIEIELTSLENFDEAIDVFIYDEENDTYMNINDSSFQISLAAGNYNKRFSLVFNENRALSTIENQLDSVIINYLQENSEIFVKVPESVQVKRMQLINLVGQTVMSWDASSLPSTNEIRVPLHDIADGNYILKVDTNYSSYNKKVIVKL